MGWSDCGKDSENRPIGYAFEGTCDHPLCKKRIDRGLSFACGEMHGADDVSCEKYFCEEHLNNAVEKSDGTLVTICDSCRENLLLSGEWEEDEMEGIIKPKP